MGANTTVDFTQFQGIEALTVKDYIEYHPDVLIVGGGICHAEDPAAAAKEIYMQLQ